MAFLHSHKGKMKLLNSFEESSPTCHTHTKGPDFARNPDDIPSDTAKMPSLSAPLFKELGAGMTVEASIVLPLFLFFFMNLACSIEMIRLHGNLQLALWKTGSELAVYGYALDSGVSPEEAAAGGQPGDTPGGRMESGAAQDGGGSGEEQDTWWKRLSGAVYSSVFVKAQLVHLLGEGYLDTSPLCSGTDSLMLWESEIFGEGNTIDLVVTYSVAPWTKTVGFPAFRMANRYYGHIWNGYAVPGESQTEGAQTDEAVYVAENGQVFHLSRDCTHLRLSVRTIGAGELAGERNNYGRRYGACEKCTGGRKTEIIYITGEGDKYHYNRDCPGLKRTVSVMLRSDAEKRYRPCSRCGKKSS